MGSISSVGGGVSSGAPSVSLAVDSTVREGASGFSRAWLRRPELEFSPLGCSVTFHSSKVSRWIPGCSHPHDQSLPITRKPTRALSREFPSRLMDLQQPRSLGWPELSHGRCCLALRCNSGGLHGPPVISRGLIGDMIGLLALQRTANSNTVMQIGEGGDLPHPLPSLGAEKVLPPSYSRTRTL